MPDTTITDERIAEIKKAIEYPHLRAKINQPSFPEISNIIARLERAEGKLKQWEEIIIDIPQTYGEAIAIYPWLKCQPHEWDNRTTVENVTYVIEAAEAERDALKAVVGLIAAEFKSDPMSVQCFDLRIVKQVIALAAKPGGA